MTHIQIIRAAEGLSVPLGTAVFNLARFIWPADPDSPSLLQTLEQWKAQRSTHCIIAEDENPGEVLAHALIFRREILTNRGPLAIGALATVCVHPDFRGRGWGEDVVRAAFAEMPVLGVEISLFQTGVPRFYEKLGARLVDNRFFNGQNPGDAGNPFWDDKVMIYPSSSFWPDGDIDLNGPGY